jgi:drug/metabolite transporter (DMT)-like permease
MAPPLPGAVRICSIGPGISLQSRGRGVALTLALLSAVFYGTADFLGGFAARRTPALAATVWAQGIGFGVALLALPIFPTGLPPAVEAAWSVGAGLTGGLGVAMLYYGFAVGRVSVIAPVTAVCSIAIPVLVAFGLGERPRALAVAGTAVAIASVALISRHEDATGGGGRRDRSLVLGLGCGIVVGAFFVCLARAGSASGVWPLLIARATSTVALAAAAVVAKVPVVIPRRVLPVVIACGVIDMVANALYLIAVREGPLGLVATLASLYPASTVLLARVVFRERLQPVQSVGLACAAAAIVMITTP